MNDSVEICIQCRKQFSITFREKIWYFRRDYSLPKRCPGCRKRRREHPDPYDGWESTMRSGGSRGHRHSRAAYAPFTVGGLTN